jgi:hypothetical protein
LDYYDSEFFTLPVKFQAPELMSSTHVLSLAEYLAAKASADADEPFKFRLKGDIHKRIGDRLADEELHQATGEEEDEDEDSNNYLAEGSRHSEGENTRPTKPAGDRHADEELHHATGEEEDEGEDSDNHLAQGGNHSKRENTRPTKSSGDGYTDKELQRTTIEEEDAERTKADNDKENKRQAETEAGSTMQNEVEGENHAPEERGNGIDSKRSSAQGSRRTGCGTIAEGLRLTRSSTIKSSRMT